MRLPDEIEARWPPDSLRRLPLHLVVRERERREPLHEPQKCLLRLDARQRRAETEMNASAERQVAVVLAPDVEDVGVGKHCGVPVGTRNHHDALLAALDVLTIE